MTFICRACGVTVTADLNEGDACPCPCHAVPLVGSFVLRDGSTTTEYRIPRETVAVA